MNKNGYFDFGYLKQYKKFNEMNEFISNSSTDALVYTGFAINSTDIITTYSNLKYATKNLEIYSNNVQFENEYLIGNPIAIDIENNLMILRLDTNRKIQDIPYAFDFDDPVALGSDVLIIGNGDNNSQSLNLLKTSVVAQSDKYFEMDIILLASLIGSPILTTDGMVAGIATSSFSENNAYSKGLNAKYIKELCDKQNIELNSKSSLKKGQEANYYVDNVLGNIFLIRIPEPHKFKEYYYSDDDLLFQEKTHII